MRLRPAVLALALGALLWAALGVRSLDPPTEFGVLDGPFPGLPRRVDGSWAVAPPLLCRLTRYPRVGIELPLPGAGEARIPSLDGSLLGLEGTASIRVREASWSSLHRAARGRGVAFVLAQAVRAAGRETLTHAPERRLDGALARRFESRLAARLDEIGVELRALDVTSIDVLLDEATPPGAETSTRLLVVGLDGADWSILDPLLERGRLPNLARLIERGTRAKLLTISPMLSPVVWTTVATGVEPSRHGVLDFLVQGPQGSGPQPVTSAQRRAATVWEILSRSGIEVGVVGWWATWPADAVRGYLVADRVAYQLFGYHADPAEALGKTWPPDLYDELRPRLVSPGAVSWDDVRQYLSGPRRTAAEFDSDERQMLRELATLIAAGRTYLELALELSRRFTPRLEIVYFEGTDTIAHLFMPYRPPPREGVDAARRASFGDAVDRYYETADAYLGRLLEGKDQRWTVLVLSDHGFATDATRPRATDSRIGHGGAADWHRRFGMLVLSGAHVVPGTHLDEASVYDIAPTILALFGRPVPRSWPGHVLAGALDPAFLERHPVRFRADDPPRESRAAGLDSAADPAARDLIEKLSALGYVASGGAGTGASATARNNAGVALMAERRYAEAEREFRAGLVEAPGAPMLVLNLGAVLRLAGRQAEAAPLLEAALGHPGTARVAALLLAEQALEDRALERARGLLQRALEAEPDAAELHNLLGFVHESGGRAEPALREYLLAAELDPDAAMPRNNLGNLARVAGRLDDAEGWYLRAIEADPYFMPAYNNLALVYQDRGEFELALDLYQRALARAPEHAELLNNVGSWYYQSGDLRSALELWTRATESDPALASPWNNLAGLAIVEGRLDDAERSLNRALALDPQYGDARLNLALVRRARGDTTGARAELVSATTDRRAAARAFAQLGWFDLERGAVDEARDAFSRSLALDPDQPQVAEALRRIEGRAQDGTSSNR